MLFNTETAKNLLGKNVSDMYGRKIGKIVAFFVDSKSDLVSIGVELNNGDFSYYPYVQMSIENNSLILKYSWQLESNQLAKEYALILRKNSALNKLHDNGEISQENYDELSKQYGAKISEITELCQSLSEGLKERVKLLNGQIKDLRTFIANLKIEYALGNIDEETYDTSYMSLQDILDRILSEKRDIELALDNLSLNNAIKKPVLLQTIPTRSSEPIGQTQPIVLRIKEAES